MKNSGYNLAAFDHFKSELLAELKGVKYNGLESMIHRMEFTYDVVVDLLDVKYIAKSAIGYTVAPGVYKISDDNLMLKSLLLHYLKVNITIDDIRLRSNITTNKTIKFSQKFFFYMILRFTQSHSSLFDNPLNGYIKKLAGTYNSEKPINTTGIDRIHLECDSFNGYVVSLRCPVLLSINLRLRKIIKIQELNFFKKINKSVLSHITFYLEDDDYKPLDFK